MRQFKMNISVRGVGVDTATAIVNFDIAVDRAEIIHRIKPSNDDRAVNCADMLDVSGMRHVDDVLDRDFDAFILRVTCGNGDRLWLGGNLNRHAFEVRLVALGCFDGVNFHGVAVPASYLDRAIHVLKFERTARLKRIDLVKLFGDGETRNCCNREDKYNQSRNKQALSKHCWHSLRERICEPRTRDPLQNQKAARTTFRATENQFARWK